jgi:hypothetical protein
MPIHTDLSLSGVKPSRQQRGLDWASGRDSGIKMDADAEPYTSQFETLTNSRRLEHPRPVMLDYPISGEVGGPDPQSPKIEGYALG